MVRSISLTLPTTSNHGDLAVGDGSRVVTMTVTPRVRPVLSLVSLRTSSASDRVMEQMPSILTTNCDVYEPLPLSLEVGAKNPSVSSPRLDSCKGSSYIVTR